MRVVGVPLYLDDKGFDAVAGGLASWPPEGPLLLDARNTKWASPYGFAAMLSLGQALRELGRARPQFAVPERTETSSYWATAGFFEHAAAMFEVRGRVPRPKRGPASGILLPVTQVRASDDVHDVVERIQKPAAEVFKQLHLESIGAPRFSMALSEACQNIIEHAGTGGWVAVHSYNYRRRLGRRAVEIAVCDPGIGFRQSLEAAEARKWDDRWGDSAALEAAVVHAVSRFRDPGRGQGLAAIKGYLLKWQGKLSIRSGTARIAVVPPWDDDPALERGLPHFPGAQLQIVVPAQEPPTA